MQEVTPKLSSKGRVGIYQVDKEKGVGRGKLCCLEPPFHHELYYLLLLTETLPSVLRREEQAHSSPTLKVL